MRFLLDQDVYCSTARFLISLGHDIVPVSHIGYAQAEDTDLLLLAQEQNRIMVTRDKDYGGLVFIGNLGTGVIYLRTLPSTQEVVHQELERVLQSYSEEELQGAFKEHSLSSSLADTGSGSFQVKETIGLHL